MTSSPMEKGNDPFPRNSQTSSNTPPPERKSLLDLPPELRNRIYHYALIQDVYVPYFPVPLAEPSLLRCNKQTREETFSIFWGGNTFHLYGTTVVDMVFQFLHRNKIAALRSVRVCYPDDLVQMFDWLDYAKNKLQRIFVGCEKKGLREGVIKMPVKVTGENEVSWFSLEEADNFEVGPKYSVVRKTKS